MSQITRFDNKNYTIAARNKSVAIRVNQMGKVMHLTADECVKLIAELENTLEQLLAETSHD